MSIPEKASSPRVFAAGVVALRGVGKHTEVLVIHRPDRRDWSLPKGKVDPGERLATTAVRETLEETGIPVVLGVPLPTVRYTVSDPASSTPLSARKSVHYWLARATDPAIAAGDLDVPAKWAPNDEVSEVRWVRVSKLAALLSYPHDLEVVEAALDSPRRTSPLVLVRHAQAERRSDFRDRVGDGPSDALRPLTDEGRAQARSLVGVLAAYGIRQVSSSSAERCMETVKPFASSRGLTVHAYDSLTEQAFAETPKQGVRDVVAMLSDPTPSTVCIHRPTKRKLVRALGHETYQPVDLALAPAEYLIFHRGAKFDDVGGVRKVKVGEGTVIEYGPHH